jgi:hypothetical protein
VPSDFFTPMMIDRYMHKLVKAYEMADIMRDQGIDPEILKNELIKPNLQMAHYDFQLSQEQADALVLMFRLRLEELFRDYIHT